ncbi:ABC transporter substrate-binding protein [Agromyces atrinae]|uniref:Extracellular solute-binding protein n=1 Tax=Agromyces atrinae TaxID=592376 RepID=A0A4Q2MDW0_9MICO|nr:extracellular solute-binding protein [Agromyces atrinae]NYD67521.1 raffinose/stachyose/melibiose transport system substrate-binding protein [Agromyces atrinae]RXZ88262.1 extracellular solute-binding protein [Agromyces atrinae]
MNSRRSRRTLLATGIAILSIGSLAACAGGSDGGSGGGEGKDPKAFTVLLPNENPTLKAQLDALAENQCAAENEALPLEHQSVAQADVVQKMTLLASQGALPVHFVAGTAQVRPDGDLGASGLIVDYNEVLEPAALDNILPAAKSTVENVYGGMVSLPYQYNVEGIWYNKQIFADNGIEEPQTWDELMDASAKLQAAGITPMAQPGAAGWPLTRIMGMYIQRNVGPEAMQAIRDGDAKLTDPEYLAGAQALADMASAGYFGEGFTTMEPDASTNAFLTGTSAMKYDGSWLLSNINDEGQNTIGTENVGFMPFPAVSGGKGSIDQWAANAGTATATSAEQFGPLVSDWLTCISENYGQQALQDAGVISGFKVNGEVTDVPETTALVQDTIANIDETVLWFEALFDPKSNSLASTNVSLLVTGQMSPEDYMKDLQASIDANK